MKRKTKATTANTPRSRSKLTRRQRIYGYRVPTQVKILGFKLASEVKNPNQWKWMYGKLPTKESMKIFLWPIYQPLYMTKPLEDICTVTPMESKQ